MNISIAFEPNILGVLARFAAFKSLLDVRVAEASKASGEVVKNVSISNMHWKNPTGELASSMEVIQDDPYDTYIGSNLPYARRREEGFDGPDSLGRVYHDKGAFFLTLALTEGAAVQEASQNFIGAIEGAWNDMVGGASGAAAIVSEV